MTRWPASPLRDLCQVIQYGYTASATEAEVGPKLLRITDIVPTLIDWKSVPYCTIDPAIIPKYLLRQGDIVIARTGATTGWAKRIRSDVNCVFASYLIRVRTKVDVSADYVGIVVESSDYRRFIHTHMGGAAQPNANAQVLASYPVPLPPLPIQRKIAAIFSTYDDLIENNERRIKILEDIAQNLYREWFVNFRFPGHTRVKMVASPLGKIPQGWEVCKLGDRLELLYGKSLKASTRAQGNVPVYGSSGIIGLHDQALVQGPGIIVGRKGNVGSIHWSFRDFYPIDTVFYVATVLNLHYLYYSLLHQTFTNSDAAVPGLNRAIALSKTLLVPHAELLETFGVTVTPLFNLKDVLNRKNSSLRQTRDLLLPKLISGEVDVSELDIRIPEDAA